MALLAGIDGCRGGWIVALLDTAEARAPGLRVIERLEDLISGPDLPDFLAIDMPIGLAERIDGAGRGPEQSVRVLLGARQSSVFSIPSRAAVEAQEYGEACRLAAATSSPPRRVSRQGFGLFPKIRELDALLRRRPEWVDRIVETHPELAFRLLKDEPLAHPKKIRGVVNPAGMAERRGLLIAAGLPGAFVHGPWPRGAAADDALDAMAALIVAREIAAGRGRPFPDPPGRDAFGLPIAIWGFVEEGPSRGGWTGGRAAAHNRAS